MDIVLRVRAWPRCAFADERQVLVAGVGEGQLACVCVSISACGENAHVLYARIEYALVSGVGTGVSLDRHSISICKK